MLVRTGVQRSMEAVRNARSVGPIYKEPGLFRGLASNGKLIFRGALFASNACRAPHCPGTELIFQPALPSLGRYNVRHPNVPEAGEPITLRLGDNAGSARATVEMYIVYVIWMGPPYCAG